MSKNKTVRNVFFTIFCLFACLTLARAESCSTAGDVQYKYTAEGCGYSTVKRTCCSNGSWSSWGTSCTYCAGNASYDYGWFRGVCYKTDPLSCSDVTLSDRTWSGGYANEDDGWWLACGCPDGASVTINQRMYADNKMDVTMACYDHQLIPQLRTGGGGMGEVTASSSSAALSSCKSNYSSTCSNMLSSTLSSLHSCTASPYSCNQANDAKRYYHDCYTNSSYNITADKSTGNKYMCVCNTSYYMVSC